MRLYSFCACERPFGHLGPEKVVLNAERIDRIVCTVHEVMYSVFLGRIDHLFESAPVRSHVET